MLARPTLALALAASVRIPPPLLCTAHPPGARGSHVLLDFVGFRLPAAESGEWMLQTMRDAVTSHGVREVHSKLVVLGERGESPPGFTAVVLIDESHVTAHCYSEEGQLAVDVFTCGVHDPRPLAANIRRHIEQRAPGSRCVLDECVGRFRDETYRAEPPQQRKKPRRAVRLRVPTSPRVQSPTAEQRAGGARMAMSSDSDDDADAFMDGEADLLSSFAERVEAEGGARRVLLESEASRAAAAAQEAQTKAGAVVTKALDLDGKAAKPSFPGGEGLLDTNSWRATVAFGGLTILLSLWAALTTDFGGVDASELDAQYERQFVRPVERDE